MEQKDYILREIEKMGVVLRAILTKIFGGNAMNAVPEENQVDEIKRELVEEVDFDLAGFLKMNDTQTIQYLKDRQDFNIQNLEDLAMILDSMGEPKKALLILVYCRNTDRTYSFERENRIRSLKERV